MADFILSLQTSDGAMVDEPGGTKVNEDSNMEYALIGLGAAYEASRDPKYLQGLEKGIQWLANSRRDERSPLEGQLYFAYSRADRRASGFFSGAWDDGCARSGCYLVVFVYCCIWTGA